MGSSIQAELYKTFAAISGDGISNVTDVVSSFADLIAEINRVAPSQRVQLQAPTTNAPSEERGNGDGIQGTVESVASTVLKSGFGVVPLVGELFGLFGGGDSQPAPQFVKYAMPRKLTFEAAEAGAGLSNADYDQSGMARVYSADQAGTTLPSGGTGQQAQVTVNIQAMDARSFLDRSNEIAAAVREAMLNLSSVNDVINDL